MKSDENSPGKYRVVYTVTMECDVVVKEGEDFQDAISNIDVPEGGQNNSVYCEGSFEIAEALHESEI